MNESFPGQTIADEAALFQRLADGHTLLTDNPTQARILQQRYSSWRLESSETRWRSPRILPWASWLDQLWDAASLAGAPGTGISVPGRRQVLSTWSAVLGDSPAGRSLLQPETLAAELARTRRLAVEWKLRLDGPAWGADQAENAVAFRRWNRAFEEHCRRRAWLPPEERSAILAAAVHSSAFSVEGPLDLLGFDEFNPVQLDLLHAVQAAGVDTTLLDLPRSDQVPRLWRAADAEVELRQMALTVRQWLADDPGARIAVIAQDLPDRRTAIEAQLGAILAPGSESLAAAPPWNISAGTPLLRHPMIEAAFDWLELARREAEIQQVSRVLRSPWLGGADAERSGRALLERRLRSRFTRTLRSNDLWFQAAVHADAPLQASTEPATPPPWKCPLLAEMLDSLNRGLGDGKQRRAPSDWAETLDAMLRAAGWPATEAPGYRHTLFAWRECLAELASLDSSVAGLSRDQALTELRHICSDRSSAPGGPYAPVQVLAPHEARGLQFDHGWVTGLSGENWPPPARPNPYIPARLQIEMGLPQASPQRQLEAARGLTRDLRNATPGCIFSFAGQSDAEAVLPSPLLGDFGTLEDADLPDAPRETWEDSIMAAPGPRQDPVGSPGPLPPGAARGGSRMLKHQSLCPFRAFAAHRLGAEPLETPGSGISPALHGSLLHRSLELFWTRTPDHAGLMALDAECLEQRVTECVQAALGAEPSLRFREALRGVEARRLVRHLLPFLDLEREREPFEVSRLEQRIEPEIAGQPIRLFIDRVDRLADGSEIILDYKSGKVHPGQWFSDRPEDPQLPLYAVAAGAPPAAVAFAVIREDGSEFKGVSSREGLLPGLPPPRTYWTETLVEAGENMPQTIADWRAVLHGLVADFLAGKVEVDPRDDRRTCTQTYCEFQPLCRIDELDPVHAVETEDLL